MAAAGIQTVNAGMFGKYIPASLHTGIVGPASPQQLADPSLRHLPSPPAQSRTDVANAVSAGLDSLTAAEQGEVGQYFQYLIDAANGVDALDPTVAHVTLPAIAAGDTYASYVARLPSGYTGVVTKDTLSFNAADLQTPASNVVRTTPAAGGEVAADRAITIAVNPEPADMPVAVPTPLLDETVDEFRSRVETTSLRVAPVAEDIDDPNLVARAVTRVSPNERQRPDGVVDVFFNPDTPATSDDDEPDCRLSSPTGVDPLPSATDYFAVYSGTVFVRTLGSGEPGFPGTDDTALLVGDIRSVAPSKGGFVGFGYRKIRAKHGWSSVDAQSTAAALQNRPTDESTPGRKIYEGVDYDGLNGARCFRLVVVALYSTGADPAPKAIVTSFGRKKVVA